MLLLYIGITLLRDDESGGPELAQGSGLLAAIRTILFADLVMSLDNVLAVAAAAQGDTVLLGIGLAISIPLIVFGSTLLIKVMDRLPVIIVLGAALLGYLAGEMLLDDPVVVARFGPLDEHADEMAGAIGAVIVVAVGLLLQRAKRRAERVALESAPEGE
jgi:predicted tellurium resistance membrane protein TerC